MGKCPAQGGIEVGKKFSSARKLTFTARNAGVRIGPGAICLMVDDKNFFGF